MRLIACPDCHTQYDVTEVASPTVQCRCGSELENRDFEAVEARVYRCGSCSAQVDSSATNCDYCGSQIIRDPGQLSLICPECYGRNASDARFCAACGVTFDPESVEAKGVELPCPCCGCLMAVRELIGISLNECGDCNGLWVPGNNMETLVQRAVDVRKQALASNSAEPEPRVKGANPSRQRVEYRKCPVCEALMQRKNFMNTSGVILDRCWEHGSWLDADELEQIAGFIMSGGRPGADAFMKHIREYDNKQWLSDSSVDAVPATRLRAFKTQTPPSVSPAGSLLELFLDVLD